MKTKKLSLSEYNIKMRYVSNFFTKIAKLKLSPKMDIKLGLLFLARYSFNFSNSHHISITTILDIKISTGSIRNADVKDKG